MSTTSDPALYTLNYTISFSTSGLCNQILYGTTRLAFDITELDPKLFSPQNILKEVNLHCLKLTVRLISFEIAAGTCARDYHWQDTDEIKPVEHVIRLSAIAVLNEFISKTSCA